MDKDVTVRRIGADEAAACIEALVLASGVGTVLFAATAFMLGRRETET